MTHDLPTNLTNAIRADNTVAISPIAKDLWLKDMQNPLRWTILPLLKLVFSFLLTIVWFAKRLPLPQFRAHRLLQNLICWFCKHFVSYEANVLILRHFATESNLLNFLIDNRKTRKDCLPIALYPLATQDMLQDSFVQHDRELFRAFIDCSGATYADAPLSWNHWQDVDRLNYSVMRRRSQVLDFETAHILFMCLFCLLLTAREYQDAINGFNLDQSIAIQIEQITRQTGFSELAYNKHPLYLLGPSNLNQRFLMHGFFTEQLNASLQAIKDNTTMKAQHRTPGPWRDGKCRKCRVAAMVHRPTGSTPAHRSP